MYSETAHDGSSSGNTSVRESPRPRSCSNIEEEEVPTPQETTSQRTDVFNAVENNENEANRLKNIYGSMPTSTTLQIPSTAADSYQIEVETR